ncbi:hypothetical protein LQF76_12225 [Gloeomargaritales cyanobacterium VI4D9]|nr:hypothetical protein LQF76_12225 [Gloeomargaritales cyanobacterium VI4D9]
MLIIALNPHLGYDWVAPVAPKADQEPKNRRQAGVELGDFTVTEFHPWVQPNPMTPPHPSRDNFQG